MMFSVQTFVLLAAMAFMGAQSQVQQQSQGTGEISGRVTDQETGRAIAGAVVRLARQGDNNGEPPSAVTDGDGRYRFLGLRAGTYTGFADDGKHLSARLPAVGGRPIALADGEALKNVDVTMARGRAITVKVVDEWGEPLSNLTVSAKNARTGIEQHGWSPRTTDDRGRLRLFQLPPGPYIICAGGLGLGFAEPGGSARRERLAQTCFPSATDERQAEPVRLEREDLGDLEIVMRRSRTWSISGVVLDASGMPAANAAVDFEHFTANGSGGTMIPVGPDGRFAVSNVAPGNYAIQASLGGTERPEQRRDYEVAFQPVHVESADVEGLVLTMVKSVDVTGRFVLEDPTIQLPPAQGSGLMILTRLTDDELPGYGGTRSATADQKREFRLTRMFGRRTLAFANVPRGWYVKSIRYGGKEIIGTATEFKAGTDPTALEVTLSSRGAFVTGRVLDDAGNPVAGARVLMTDAAPSGRDTFQRTMATASPGGDFRLGPDRAGDYVVVAIGRGEEWPDPRDRERMAALLERGERVTLGSDEERSVDLRVRKPR